MSKEYVLERILDYAIDKDNVWIITTEFPNYFFKYNLCIKKLERIIKFPDIVYECDVPFRYLRIVGSEIYFFSEELNDIYIWGMDTGEFQTLNLGNAGQDLFKGKWIYPIESEKYIYCISVMSRVLVQIEKASKKSKIVDISYGYSVENRIPYKAYYTFLPCLYEGKVLIPIRDKIISYDEENGTIDVFAEPQVQVRSLYDDFQDYLCGIVCCKNQLVIYTYCGEIFQKEGVDFKRIREVRQEEIVKKDGYYRPVFQAVSVLDDEIIFWVSFTHYAYRYMAGETQTKFIKQELGKDVLITGSTIKRKDNDCIIVSWKTKDIFRFNAANGGTERFQIGFDLNTVGFYRVLCDVGVSGIISVDCLQALFTIVNSGVGIEENSSMETVGSRIHKSLL